ncbi:MAG: DEAD/DEAH box helicase, partial [Candidatus Aminicenantes bacterium]|nr:DEAD/DEAH box helicase [Candidatus Aminicenantes bacterium]
MASEFTLQEVFSPGGLLAGELPGYEFRPSQLELSLSVLEAIREGHHLCAEAGTGTGKTLAYLVPALASRRKTIISTATRNLQEQLYLKDIPFIR